MVVLAEMPPAFYQIGDCWILVELLDARQDGNEENAVSAGTKLAMDLVIGADESEDVGAEQGVQDVIRTGVPVVDIKLVIDTYGAQDRP